MIVRLLVPLFAAMLGGCSLLAASSGVGAGYTAEAAASADSVRSALLAVDPAVGESALGLPPAVIEARPDGVILWSIYAGTELAGQLQITLAPAADGTKTTVTAIYAASQVSPKYASLPGLSDPRPLRVALQRALTAVIKSLEPGAALTAAESDQAATHLTIARTMANSGDLADRMRQQLREADTEANTEAALAPVGPGVYEGLAQQADRLEDTARITSPATLAQPVMEMGKPMLDPTPKSPSSPTSRNEGPFGN